MDQPEFHHHVGRGRIYSHPLIRYDTSNGSPVISGLGDGAYLLRAMPAINRLRIGNEEYVVSGQSDRAERFEIGPTSSAILYELSSPYLALNQKNYRLWTSASARERDELLSRIIVGNILSFSKAIGLSVRDRIVAEPSLEPNGHFTLKPGVKLFGFRGSFRVNFQLPSGWGLGKSSSRGFGTVQQLEVAT